MNVRRSDFSGSWYPGTEQDCLKSMEGFVDDSLQCPHNKVAVGGIVPHAGWLFSGKIAYNTIRCLNRKRAPDTCIIFGRHLHQASNNYIMKEGRWSTPMGDLEIDVDVAAELTSEFDFTVETPSRYEPDNTIELQLPFIKHFFPKTAIVPIGLGPRTESLEIARKVVEIAKGMGRITLVLGSTDLTHYGYNYGFAPKGVGEEAVTWVKEVNDRSVVEVMMKLEGEGVIRESLKHHNVCCSGAAAAAIEAAKELGATCAEKISYSTSYDVRPDNSFVGYVGLLFCE